MLEAAPKHGLPHYLYLYTCTLYILTTPPSHGNLPAAAVYPFFFGFNSGLCAISINLHFVLYFIFGPVIEYGGKFFMLHLKTKFMFVQHQVIRTTI